VFEKTKLSGPFKRIAVPNVTKLLSLTPTKVTNGFYKKATSIWFNYIC